MMFDKSDTNRIFYTPLSINFAQYFIQGLRNRLAGKSPDELARVEIFVNTQRTKRRLIDLFISQGATLLPRLRVLNDLVDDPYGLCDIPHAIDPLQRKLELGQLIRHYLHLNPGIAPLNSAFVLAETLAALMDEAKGQGVDLHNISQLDISDHSKHWMLSQKFLSIVVEYWEKNPLSSPRERLRYVAQCYGAYWQKNPPQHPVLVVGSTGSRGETATFMSAVSRLPQGAVILPGFDSHLCAEIWKTLCHKNTLLDHSQSAISRLLDGFGMLPQDVPPWGDDIKTPRQALISLALRPAPVTDQWLEQGPKLKPSLSEATSGISLIEAATEKEEVAAIAIALRDAAEKGIDAALVTPNRNLTRRVSNFLLRWGIVPDDSAGDLLHLSAPGILMCLVANAMGGVLSAEKLLGILKHNLTHTGEGRNFHNLFTQELETQVLRGGAPTIDFNTIVKWGQKSSDKMQWVIWIHKTLAPLTISDECPIVDWVRLHRSVLEALSKGSMGDNLGMLWQKDAGIAALGVMENISKNAEAGGVISAAEYASLVRSELNQALRTKVQTAHPKISIWGTLEARVQSKDFIILGGMNEGTWPPKTDPDMWLNRTMRDQLGLLLPERRIGLSAHDFQQAICNRKVILSRALREGDVPSLPSRWLVRLTNLLDGLDKEGQDAFQVMKKRGRKWITLAQALENFNEYSLDRATRPSPIPSVNARFNSISVTQVKTLIRNPYEIYAQKILKLKKLEPLSRNADARDRGNTIHLIMERFIQKTRDGLPDNAEDLLMSVADEVLVDDIPWPAARRMWRGRIAQVAAWFVKQEKRRRDNGHPIALEYKGEFQLHPMNIKLRVKADRIDQGKTGLRIYDYKAAKPPTPKQIKLFDKQLLLEAALAQFGAFSDLPAQEVEHICYIGLSSERVETPQDLNHDIIAQVWADFIRLITLYLSEKQGFTARDRMEKNTDISDYDHLSRFGEWQSSDKPDPKRVP